MEPTFKQRCQKIKADKTFTNKKRKKKLEFHRRNTIDGRNPANQLIGTVGYPRNLQRILYIQTVVVWDFRTINRIFV